MQPIYEPGSKAKRSAQKPGRLCEHEAVAVNWETGEIVCAECGEVLQTFRKGEGE